MLCYIYDPWRPVKIIKIKFGAKSTGQQLWDIIKKKKKKKLFWALIKFSFGRMYWQLFDWFCTLLKKCCCLCMSPLTCTLEQAWLSSTWAKHQESQAQIGLSGAPAKFPVGLPSFWAEGCVHSWHWDEILILKK